MRALLYISISIGIMSGLLFFGYYFVGFRNIWNRWKLWIHLHTQSRPEPEYLVLRLVLHTASLELMKNEYVELAPVKGCCGPFRLTGTGLPVFEYLVFDKTKDMMEFVKIRVEVAKPDRIHYMAHIESQHTADPKRHGEMVEVKPKYKDPFETLSFYLYQYFPLYRAKGTGIKKMM